MSTLLSLSTFVSVSVCLIRARNLLSNIRYSMHHSCAYAFLDGSLVAPIVQCHCFSFFHFHCFTFLIVTASLFPLSQLLFPHCHCFSLPLPLLLFPNCHCLSLPIVTASLSSIVTVSLSPMSLLIFHPLSVATAFLTVFSSLLLITFSVILFLSLSTCTCACPLSDYSIIAPLLFSSRYRSVASSLIYWYDC